MKTLNVNIWGGPGTGKSIVAANLFGTLKLARVSCEMAREYAKELTWEGRIVGMEQLWISAEQHRRQATLQDRCSVVITDSPIVQGALFAPQEYLSELTALLTILRNRWENVDILLKPLHDEAYEREGRLETPEEAGAHHEKVAAMAKAVCGPSLIEATLTNAVVLALPRIFTALSPEA